MSCIVVVDDEAVLVEGLGLEHEGETARIAVYETAVTRMGVRPVGARQVGEPDGRLEAHTAV